MQQDSAFPTTKFKAVHKAARWLVRRTSTIVQSLMQLLLQPVSCLMDSTNKELVRQLREQKAQTEQYKLFYKRTQLLAMDLSKLVETKDKQIQQARYDSNIVQLTPAVLEKERQRTRLETLYMLKKLLRIWIMKPHTVITKLEDLIKSEETNERSN